MFLKSDPMNFTPLDLHSFHVLHEAALQVARSSGLHRRVDEPLAAGHAVEEELLWPYPGQEPPAHQLPELQLETELPFRAMTLRYVFLQKKHPLW